MKRFRWLIYSLLGLVATGLSLLLTPGTWLNRIVSLAVCTMLSTEPAICSLSAARWSQRTVAAEVPLMERVAEVLAQRDREFTDPDPPPSPSPSSGNEEAPPFPYDPGPDFIRDDFGDRPVSSDRPANSQVYEISSTTSEGCRIIRRVKREAGHSFYISMEYLHQDISACGDRSYKFQFPENRPQIIGSSSLGESFSIDISNPEKWIVDYVDPAGGNWSFDIVSRSRMSSLKRFVDLDRRKLLVKSQKSIVFERQAISQLKTNCGSIDPVKGINCDLCDIGNSILNREESGYQDWKTATGAVSSTEGLSRSTIMGTDITGSSRGISAVLNHAPSDPTNGLERLMTANESLPTGFPNIFEIVPNFIEDHVITPLRKSLRDGLTKALNCDESECQRIKRERQECDNSDSSRPDDSSVNDDSYANLANCPLTGNWNYRQVRGWEYWQGQGFVGEEHIDSSNAFYSTTLFLKENPRQIETSAFVANQNGGIGSLQGDRLSLSLPVDNGAAQLVGTVSSDRNTIRGNITFVDGKNPGRQVTITFTMQRTEPCRPEPETGSDSNSSSQEGQGSERQGQGNSEERRGRCFFSDSECLNSPGSP